MKNELIVLPDIEEGFIRGSIWENIYSFYRYKGEKFKVNTNIESIELMIQIYTFALIELKEALAINKSSELTDMKKRIENELEKLNNYLKNNSGDNYVGC